MSESIEAQPQIQTASFFKGLNPDSVQRAIAHVVTRHHPENQVILLENDWGNSVYFILAGWVKVRTYNMEGKEVTLNILGKGEMFGEMASLDLITRSTDVITLTDANIASLPAPDFMYLLENEPLAGIRLARLLARRLRQVNRRLRLREADSTSRVADVLLFLVEGQGVASEEGIAIPNLPHRELSSLSGLARETVTRALGKLERKNLIRRDHEKDVLRILDINGLEALMI
jgi:CRP/FNR family transcriptional regulator, cyclic AMP receptor protein